MKRILILATLLLSTLIFSGCVKKINEKGLVLWVSQDSLNESIAEEFPIKHNFILGKITIDSPKVQLYKNKRVEAKVNMKITTLFKAPFRGTFMLSGEPKFDERKRALFLDKVSLDKLEFTQLQLPENFQLVVGNVLEPLVNRIFKDMPIYKIPKESFHGKFVKDVEVEDEQLLITYGF